MTLHTLQRKQECFTRHDTSPAQSCSTHRAAFTTVVACHALLYTAPRSAVLRLNLLVPALRLDLLRRLRCAPPCVCSASLRCTLVRCAVPRSAALSLNLLSLCCALLSRVAPRLARQLRCAPPSSSLGQLHCVSPNCAASQLARPCAASQLPPSSGLLQSRLLRVSTLHLGQLRCVSPSCASTRRHCTSRFVSLRCTRFSCVAPRPAVPCLDRSLSTWSSQPCPRQSLKTGEGGDGVSSSVLTRLCCRQPHPGASPVWLSGSPIAHPSFAMGCGASSAQLCEHLRSQTFSSKQLSHSPLVYGASAARLTPGSRRFGALTDALKGWCSRC